MNLTLREWSALASAALMLGGGTWYIVQILRKEITPVFAAWIVLGGTLCLSFATYWTNPAKSLVSNAANAAAAFEGLATLVVLAIQNMKSHEKISFSPFQKFCLKVSALIAALWVTIVWGFHGTGFIPNVLTQLLMIIGYVVMVPRLWNATKNTDSYVLWSCIGLSCLFGLYTAAVSGDKLAVLYASRGFIASATIVCLMYRADRKYRLATT